MKRAAAPLHVEHGPHFVGGLGAVVLVEHPLDGHGDAPQAPGVPVAVQGLVEQGDKARLVAGEPVVQVVARSL